MARSGKTRRDRRRDPPRRADAKTQELGPTILALGAALILTFVAYVGVFHHSFVSLDDATNVTQNPLVQGKQYGALLRSIVNNSYIPVTMVSLALNAERPLSPRPFLATNLAIHLVNTGLVFCLALALSRRRILAAFLAALLFGIHPMHVESVAWVSSRKDVLYALFFLGGLMAYWRYLERRAWPWLLATFGLFVLSCLSKGMAVVFPPVLVLLDYWKRRPILERGALLEKVPFFATALLFGLIAVDAEAGRDFHGLFTVVDRQLKATMSTESFTPYLRVALPSFGFMMYTWRILVPIRLGVFYPYPTLEEALRPPYLISIAFFLGAIALAIWSVRRNRTLALGLGWYLLVILPVLQWIPVGASTLADRMTYLAYAGPFVALAMGADALFRSRRAARVWLAFGLAIVLGFFFVRAVRQVETWTNSETLWANVVRLYPRSDRPYIARGNARGEAGNLEGAMADFRTAMNLGSRDAGVFDGLGTAYGAMNRPDSALVMYDRALAIDSTLGRTYANRAIVHLRLEQPREALEDLDRASALLPVQTPTFHFPRGNAYMRLGRYREAEEEFGNAIEAGQLVTDARFNRAACRLRLNDAAGAREDLEAVLRLDPGYGGAREQLRAIGD